MADNSVASSIGGMSDSALNSMTQSALTNVDTTQKITQLNAMTDLNSALCTVAAKVGSSAKAAAQGGGG